ncbi:glycosyl hydrolase family 61-domain-containing protein [Crepidotus variabilis]|uniref:lytic cellulose monooxygenase (C4-dehydrogenating) n=1 Tax=Crepidotus variabilis TaxID=179855 RepID=A0A9P6EA17_9AGAR|nr:glycosyl hydrolase family 61-domain-containing protein [Crepidotus variabilis]
MFCCHLHEKSRAGQRYKYIFATLLTGSSSSSAAVRLPKENGPVKDFTSQGATCNVDIIKPASETVQVNAGSQVGFKLGEGKTIFHAGPAAMYLGKAPGKAADWDGSGQSWSKIAEWGATFNPFKFIATGMDTFTANLPADIPDGEYLLRMEHYALHIPRSPELYVGCAQIKVSGGGNAQLATVSIPGYIPANDPSLLMDIYYPVPTAYKVPGPPVAGKSNESSASASVPPLSNATASPPASAPSAPVPPPSTDATASFSDTPASLPTSTPSASASPATPVSSTAASSSDASAPAASTSAGNNSAAPSSSPAPSDGIPAETNSTAISTSPTPSDGAPTGTSTIYIPAASSGVPAPLSSVVPSSQGVAMAAPSGAPLPSQGPQSPARPPPNNAPAHPSAPWGAYPSGFAPYFGGQGGYGFGHHQDGNCKKSSQGKRPFSQHRRRLQHSQF